MIKIAFYSPIKPFDHHIASGDRLIAKNILTSLSRAGFDPQLATSFISYMKRPILETLHERKKEALKEADEILKRWSQENYKPDIFFTYHPYCKAPDWIGEHISKSLKIPRITAEACRTGQDNFEVHRKEAQNTILSADAHFYLKPIDKEYLLSIGIDEGKLFNLPPFIDTLEPADNIDIPKSTPLFTTVGMMRPGKKVKNYHILAETLKEMKNEDWQLAVIGDGPGLPEIKNAFKSIPEEKLIWLGALPRTAVLAWMEKSVAMIWPGDKEPIGMVYLEAASVGTPSIAFHSMGVPLVVSHNESGLLATEGNKDELRENIRLILKDKNLVDKLSQQAKVKQKTQHSIQSTAAVFAKKLPEFLSQYNSKSQ